MMLLTIYFNTSSVFLSYTPTCAKMEQVDFLSLLTVVELKKRGSLQKRTSKDILKHETDQILSEPHYLYFKYLSVNLEMNHQAIIDNTF